MRILHAGGPFVRQLVYTQDGQLTALLGDHLGYQGVRQFSLVENVEPISHSFSAVHAALAPSQAIVALFEVERGLSLRNVSDFRPRVETTFRRAATIALAFSPDARQCFVASRSESERVAIHVISVRDGTRVVMQAFSLETPRHLAIRPDGVMLAMAGGDQVVQCRPQSLGPVDRWNVVATGPIVYSPTGRTLAVASHEYVLLWDTLAGAQRQALVGHQAPVLSIAFSPDHRWIVTGATDRTVRIWDATTGMLQQVFEWPTGPVHALAVAPDGLTVAAGGESGDVVVWDVDE